MTATNPRPRAKRVPRRPARLTSWLIPSALLALAPKCVLCLLAYAGLGAALRIGGPELCGATTGSAGHWLMWLPTLGLTGGAAGFFVHGRRRRV